MKPLSLDMNTFELHDWIAEHGPVHVVFSEGSHTCESYPNEGIQGLVLGVMKDTPNEEGVIDVAKWVMDYTQFEVINSLNEESNYYRRSGTELPHLKAYSAGHYKRKDHLYMNPIEPLSAVLQSIAPAATVGVTSDAVEQRFAEIEKALGSFSI